MAIRSLEAPAARHVVGVSFLAFRIAHQEQVDVIRLKRRIERGRQMLARTHGLHEMRGHDDDEIGLALLEVGRSEERADHRHVAEPGELIDALRILTCSKPAIAKLCPSRSSTAVCALRSVKEGTVVPLMFKLLALPRFSGQVLEPLDDGGETSSNSNRGV